MKQKGLIEPGIINDAVAWLEVFLESLHLVTAK